jgi:hypothetical protein
MTARQELDKRDFNFQRHMRGKSFHIQPALKEFLFEERGGIDLLWEI